MTEDIRVAVSNTGPLISAFQSDRVDILRRLYDLLYIPASELTELEEHGAKQAIQSLLDAHFVAICDDLTEMEKAKAKRIAEEIARSPVTKDKNPGSHYPEAEAMVLMQRAELNAVEILLDELAARQVAQRRGIPVVGFPGVLIRACRQGMITSAEVRDALRSCQQQGTHYSNRLIDQIFERLQRERDE
jgi:predicted nucleic acid-binding protein